MNGRRIKGQQARVPQIPLCKCTPDNGASFRGEEVHDIPADQLLGGVSDHAPALGACIHHDPLSSHLPDGVRSGLDEVPELGFPFLEGIP